MSPTPGESHDYYEVRDGVLRVFRATFETVESDVETRGADAFPAWVTRKLAADGSWEWDSNVYGTHAWKIPRGSGVWGDVFVDWPPARRELIRQTHEKLLAAREAEFKALTCWLAAEDLSAETPPGAKP